MKNCTCSRNFFFEMAEVENLSAMTVAATAADIPKVSKGSGSDVGGGTELGTSPAQERSSNSHPHDSEYDTASDLEGGDHDDYDDDEEEDDDEDDDGERYSFYGSCIQILFLFVMAH